jgi:hypothetical protein
MRAGSPLTVGKRMHPKPSAEMGRPGILGNEQYRMTGSLPASASHRHLYQRLFIY